MKKERLITAEVNDNVNLALFNIDDIISTLNEGFDQVNAMFGTELRARLNPIIEQQQEAAAEPEQESEPEEDADQSEAEPEQESDAQSEAEPEPEAEPDIQESEINVEISGDNNIIIIGGDENADDKPEEDDPPDVPASDGGDGSLDGVQSVSDDTQQD
jgi:hypothetical protein